jgi:hypothetical protein
MRPAFPRERPAQLRTESPAWGLAALNLGTGPKQGRIRAGQSLCEDLPRSASSGRGFTLGWMVVKIFDRHLTVALD